MKFKKGDIVKIIEDVGTWEDWGTWIEKGAVGRVIEVDEYGCWVEPVEGYGDMFLGGNLRRVLEGHIELYEGGMNKELENTQLFLDLGSVLYRVEKALTPPTEEEMCKALSEHLGEKIVFEGFSLHNIDMSKGVCVFNPKTKEIEIIVELPPHLIIMIGRFYEGVKT